MAALRHAKALRNCYAILSAFCCLALGGCYVPVTFDQTDVVSQTSSLPRTVVEVENGELAVLATPSYRKHMDFSGAKFLSAVVTDEDGRQISLTPSRISKNRSDIEMYFDLKKVGLRGHRFGLKVEVEVEGAIETVTGQYRAYRKTKIVDEFEELDHG